MLIKPDSRRRIDGLIDYFGGGRSAQDADRERRLDDRLARDEWGWKPQHDLESMTRDMVPKCLDLIAKGLLPRE